MMNEMNVKYLVEFKEWLSKRDVSCVEHLDKIKGHENQDCFEVEVINNGVYFFCVDKSETEIFLNNLDELNDWVEVKKGIDLINNGLSDSISGFNEFECTKNNEIITFYIDVCALI
jgi:hypothetical protein